MSVTVASIPQSFDASTQYQSFVNNVESTTTLDTYILKQQVTTTQLTAGRYIVHYSAEVTNTLKNKSAGYNVKWREDGVTAFADLHISSNGPNIGDSYETRAGFRELTLTADGTFTFQTFFGYSIDGGTAKIKDTNIYLFKVGE